MVFERGAFGTLRMCVRHWERLETWALTEDVLLLPLTETLLLKYFLFL